MLLLVIAIAIGLTSFKEDVKYLEYYSINIDNPKIAYELNTKDKDNNNLDSLSYEPNVHSFTGITLGNEYTSLTFSFQNEDKDKKDIEPTSVFDLQFLGQYKNFLWEAFYQNYQGLYITDSEFLESSLPTANSWSYGADLKYFTKKDFKLRKSLGNFSQKKITDWSWLWGTKLSKARLFSSETLIPSQYASNFDQLVGLKAIETTSLGLQFGISGLFSYKKYFISGLIAPGIQLQKQEFSGIDAEDRVLTDSNFSLIIETGYDSNSWGSLGLQLRGSGGNIPIKNASFELTRSISTLYYKYFF